MKIKKIDGTCASFVFDVVIQGAGPFFRKRLSNALQGKLQHSPFQTFVALLRDNVPRYNLFNFFVTITEDSELITSDREELKIR